MLLALLKKDLLLEWRQKHALFGVLLYVGSTVFVVFMMTGRPVAAVWNALFWITQLFVAVNSVSKSFLQEPPQRFRYYYTLVRPTTFILAKMIYSVLLMLVMSGVSFVLFSTLLGMPLLSVGKFVAVCAVGSISLSVVFTFLSAIASRAGQGSSLMAILGFPLMTPVLLLLSSFSQSAISPIYEGWWGTAGVLLGLSGLVLLLGMILFPFLWRE